MSMFFFLLRKQTNNEKSHSTERIGDFIFFVSFLGTASCVIRSERCLGVSNRLADWSVYPVELL
jgi:hypothetical protein